MLNRLLSLYYKQNRSGKTPLEDFTTEALAGVLESNDQLKVEFLSDFLKLPTDNYTIITQKKYFLEGDVDCIIDLALIGEKNVCFIENKVHSSEGDRQLERYASVLDSITADEEYLLYCTKYTDPKTIKDHNFKQFRRHQIVHFLERYRDQTIANEFNGFLNKRTYDERAWLGALEWHMCLKFCVKLNNIILKNYNLRYARFRGKKFIV